MSSLDVLQQRSLYIAQLLASWMDERFCLNLMQKTIQTTG